MNEDLIFSLANTLALVGWVLLILLPRAKVTSILVHQLALPLLFAVAYGVVLFAGRAAFSGGGFGSLTQVMALFGHRRAVLAGWLHYLAFDLFVGSYISRDRQSRGIPAWQVVPALFLTFMFGPLGLLTYSVQRQLRKPRAA